MSVVVRPDRHGVWRLESHDRLVSTSDSCIARAEQGEADGLAILARRQTGARGSRGRSWTEPLSGNLALSVLLRTGLDDHPPSVWPFLAGLSLLDGLRQVSPASLRLKWPNDVMLDQRKLAGILIERGYVASAAWMVIGFGANLVSAPVLPDRQVACLAEAGPAPDQEAAASSVLAALHRWRLVLDNEGFAPIRAAWLQNAHPIGTPLAIGTPGAQTEGSFSGIAGDGALLLMAGGCEQRVETGEVLMLGGR